jgi:formylglycine-generating enzyme required for sulfatase activity
MPERTSTGSNALTLPATAAIPAGRFRMGSEEGRPDEQPVHAAEVGPFRMAVTPVTVRHYGRFLVQALVEPPPWWEHPDFRDPEQPVVGVSWFDAVAFAAWLTAVTGDSWRLPTEAEWEWSALGGREGAATAWGESLPAREVPDGPLSGPWRVGQGTPNPHGLFDMGTIVHEWCLDEYRPYGTLAPADPTTRGPLRRSSRGGSWRHRQRWSSPSARSSLLPESRYADYGFRPLLEIGSARQSRGVL